MVERIVKTKWFWVAPALAAVTLIWAISFLRPSPYLTGNVTQTTFKSDILNDTRRIWVYLPPGYERSQASYPVLIMHDGQNVFDGNTSTHKGIEWGVDETLEQMITRGEIPPLIVAAIESTDTRSDDYLPERVINNGRTEGGRAPDYAAMLKTEFLPYLQQTYRLKSGPNNTYVGGSSYGGVLSFYLAMTHSDMFGAALVVSPSTSWNNRWMKRTADALFWKHDVKLWMDYGFSEFQPDDFFDTVEALEAKGWRSHYELGGTVDGGFHFEGAWARRFPMMIRWLMNDAVFYEEPAL